MNIFRSPFFLTWIYPQLTWRIKTSAKVLYLTFDDGPVPGPTEFVLETLKKSNAKATFFCIGDNVKKNPSVFNKIIKDGHAIGNHTFNHLSGWKTRTTKYLENIEQCAMEISSHHVDQTVSEEAGRRPLFRPPYGRITRNQIRNLSPYNIIMWDVLTHDYAGSLAPESCLAGSLAAARPGSIVVFHDSYKAEKNMTYTLPRFIEHFAGLGYEFKSLR